MVCSVLDWTFGTVYGWGHFVAYWALLQNTSYNICTNIIANLQCSTLEADQPCSSPTYIYIHVYGVHAMLA